MQDGDVIVSKFYWWYYIRGCAGAVVFTYFTGLLAYAALFRHVAQPGTVAALAVAFAGLTGVFFYFFSKSWKKVTISPAGITVDYLFKKQQFIMYTGIIRMDAYKAPGSGGGVFGQYFVIEFYDGQVSFSETYYENYTALKAAIYNYKLGFNRQRSRY